MPASRAQRVTIADRRAKLVAARRQRIPFEKIYEELGYKSSADARKDFHRALEQSIAAQHASVEVYREEQLLELDHLAEEAHKVMRAQHYVMAPGGKVVMDPDDDTHPLIDDAPTLAAIDRLVKILDRVAKLRGLDAPTKVEGAFTLEALDKALADARERLAAFGPEDPEDGETEEPRN